jgi:hypothetical protein
MGKTLTDEERYRIILEMDLDAAVEVYPLPISREDLLIGMHKARYLFKTMPAELRHASRQWLEDNGHNTWMGQPLPPVGEFL